MLSHTQVVLVSRWSFWWTGTLDTFTPMILRIMSIHFGDLSSITPIILLQNIRSL